ncbi:MAG: hypothetical protein ABJK39_08400 [Hyphomicrobiales bacterium]
MAYFEFDEGHPVDPYHITRTLGMAGMLALSTWDIWARHLAPLVFGTELSVAALFQEVLGIESRLQAEFIYLVISLAVLSPAYFFIWRPIMSFLSPTRHWSIDGLSFGIVIFSIFLLLNALLGATLSIQLALLGWFPGVLASWFMTSLFIRLREMNCKIV